MWCVMTLQIDVRLYDCPQPCDTRRRNISAPHFALRCSRMPGAPSGQAGWLVIRQAGRTQVTDELRDKIQAHARDQDIYSKLARSIAPEIYGHEVPPSPSPQQSLSLSTLLCLRGLPPAASNSPARLLCPPTLTANSDRQLCRQ